MTCAEQDLRQKKKKKIANNARQLSSSHAPRCAALATLSAWRRA